MYDHVCIYLLRVYISLEISSNYQYMCMYACMHVCIGNGKIRDKQGTKSRQKKSTRRACHSFPGGVTTGEHNGVKRGRTQRYTTGGKQRENEKCHVYGGQNNKKCFYNILNF